MRSTRNPFKFETFSILFASMLELVDINDLESLAERRAGSSPA